MNFLVSELCIGGHGVARDYLGQPELMDQRFVPDPFRPGMRLYRTGDRARRRADDALELLGRMDQQIKLRGLRIEPGEIEAVMAHPAVARVAVVLASPGGHHAPLVAWVVFRGADCAGEVTAHVAAFPPAQAHGACCMPVPGGPAAEPPWQGGPSGTG